MRLNIKGHLNRLEDALRPGDEFIEKTKNRFAVFTIFGVSAIGIVANAHGQVNGAKPNVVSGSWQQMRILLRDCSNGQTVAGAIDAVAPDPTNKNNILIASSGNGGMEWTPDGGRHWAQNSQANNGLSITAVNDVARDQSNPNVLVGVLGGRGAAPSGTIVTSADNGKTWTDVMNTPDQPDAVLKEFGFYAVAQAKNGNWYVAMNGGVQYSDNGAQGEWLFTPMSNPDGSLSDTNMISVVASNNTVFLGSADGKLYSQPVNNTVADWSFLKDFGGAVASIAVNPKNDNQIYVVAGKKLYLSNDGANSWINPQLRAFKSPKNRKLVVVPVAGINTVAVDADSGAVYLGTDNGLFVFKNGLKTAQQSLQNVMVDRIKIVNGTAYVATDRGLFIGSGTNFRNANGNLNNFSLNSFSVNGSSLYGIVNGYGLVKSQNKGRSWARECKIPGAENGEVAASASYVYVTEGNVFYSDDNGLTFNKSANQLSGASTIVIDPRNPSTAYFNTLKGIYISTNGGKSISPWLLNSNGKVYEILTVDPSNSQVRFIVDVNSNAYYIMKGSNLTPIDQLQEYSPSLAILQQYRYTFSVDPKNDRNKSATFISDNYFNGDFFSTSDGLNWIALDNIAFEESSAQYNNYAVARAGILYGKINGFEIAWNNIGISASTDGGQSWDDVTGNLPIGGFQRVVLSGSTAYVATDGNGVFKSIVR